jgi:glycylpeptide N-tetradecanoyltransferase
LNDTHTFPAAQFWKTQPVPQNLSQNATAGSSSSQPAIVEGPIDPPKTVADIRSEPLPLPAGYEWSMVDVLNDDELSELRTLLSENYVEDDDASFRLNYSKEFLLW